MLLNSYLLPIYPSIIVADDVHEWILAHGGGKYITDTMRTIMAVQQDR